MFTVVICGRQNVGKSTLFNRIVGRRKALVHDEPGVTRDLNISEASYHDKKFLVVDTGGILLQKEESLLKLVEEQVKIAVEMADIALFVVDRKDGIVSLDNEIAKMLRKSGKKCILVVNKVDVDSHVDESYTFHSLGFKEIYLTSAEHDNGIINLLDKISEDIQAGNDKEVMPDAIRIAIVGRPNVGKSSLVNRLIGKERMIVSDLPGTTRDSIDTFIDRKEGSFLIIDTAGIRRKGKTERGAEVLSVVMARKAIDNCDVAILVIDSNVGITHQDLAIASIIEKARCGAMVVANKWDLLEGNDEKRFEVEEQISERFAFLFDMPVERISALTGRRVNLIWRTIVKVNNSYRFEITTPLLNKTIQKIQSVVSPPSIGGKDLRIRYAVQVKNGPPQIALFTNSRLAPNESYRRFLTKELISSFHLTGTPIVLQFRTK